ncbi:hypothetical protein [Pseudomonas sp. BRM28]|uniref:hypothetical protein n=1 Tax=Pseudomonas sp. BRM28 TaxID=2045201 RepID=UPI000CEF2AD2|nr:hypothetical protein [Pseudomonas sp. BRM28]PPS59710.1 hypothetical protein CR917_01610 [Pseudomonas sp. BRM28]
MEVGAIAVQDGTAVESVVSQLHVVKDDRETIELSCIDTESVRPLIQVLQDAPLGKKIRIYLRANPGGNVGQLQDLIEALARTNADVEIAVGRFAMSCAAVLWLWYALDPINLENDPNEGRVVSVDPLKPAVLMYHRPRWPEGEYYCFIDDFKNKAIRASVRDQVDMFDDLFYRYLEDQGLQDIHTATYSTSHVTYKHVLQHMLEAYQSNKDCFIPL